MVTEIKLNTKFWQRMQNFLFLNDNEVFWTSASLNMKDRWNKFICWIVGKEYFQTCHTSKGFKIPGHGQIIWSNGLEIFTKQDNGKMFAVNPYTGSTILAFSPKYPYTVPKLDDEEVLQGICQRDGVLFYLLSKRGKECGIVWVDRGDEDDPRYEIELHLVLDKWYILDWEYEGIQCHDGEIWVGVNTRNILGMHSNEIVKLSI